MRNYTVAAIKKSLTNKGNKSGFIFSTKNPYYANDGRLKSMRSEWMYMTEIDDARHQTPLINKKTRKSIDLWLGKFAEKYL